MWDNRNYLAIRQQFRADFRMTPDKFMHIVTLVNNSLEKQDIQFRETVPIEKKSNDCFMAFTDWKLLPQCFENMCCWKIHCGKHYKKLLRKN